jgi:HEAT repeat protein
MKFISGLILMIWAIMPLHGISVQDQQARIDSLVNLLKGAGREWNDYSKPLIAIGEPAVPALVEVAEDRGLEQWNRRTAIMTLNDIHSELWVKPALRILFDRKEDPVIRNQITGGLDGFDLSDVKEELGKVYEELTDEFSKLNLAYLLMHADTSRAYWSFLELYNHYDGYVQKMALVNLVKIRPDESTIWFLEGIQMDDWMTANMAMDSLVAVKYFVPEDLISLYNDPDVSEKVRWRIVYVLGHRNESESVPALLKAFRAESWLVHTEAAVGLCRFHPEEIIPEMKALKNDPRPYIRDNSRWVIRQMSDP